MKGSSRRFIWYVLILSAAALLVINFHQVWSGVSSLISILMPFFLGIALAYLWNIPCVSWSGIISRRARNPLLRRPDGL